MILDYIFPKYSLSGDEGTWITKTEFARLKSHPRIFSQEELKSRGVSSVDRVFAASGYRDCPLLKKAIATFKYKRIPGLGNALQTLMSDAVSEFYTLRGRGCICPVPLHFTRRFHRGFNQAEILAAYLSCNTGLPLVSLLTRTRPTGNQSKRKKAERWKAMRGAFRSLAHIENMQPSCVYLVDDLFTTGATMEECAKILKDSGVRRVEGIVLAHG